MSAISPVSIQDALLCAVDAELNASRIDLSVATPNNSQRRQGLLVVYQNGLELQEVAKRRTQASVEGSGDLPSFPAPAKCTTMSVSLLQEFVEQQLPPPSAEFTSSASETSLAELSKDGKPPQHHAFTRQAKSLTSKDIVVVAVACNVVPGVEDSLYYDIFIRQL